LKVGWIYRRGKNPSILELNPPFSRFAMAEIRTVTTLVRKRDEIRASIRMYEKKLEQGRVDLAHITAVLRLFEVSGRAQDLARYSDHYRLFKRGEPWAICKAALASGPQTTKELALALIRAKGMDERDGTLAKTIGHRLIHSLRMQEKRKQVDRDGKRHGVSVWRLP
jgi:hypothetical protein